MPIKNAPLPLRLIRSRPRLFSATAFGIFFALLLPWAELRHPVTQAIIGWNAGASLYLLLALQMMFNSPRERMRSRARRQDEGRIVVLILVVFAALISLGAVIVQLSIAREATGTEKYTHIALAATTIATSWAFTQIMFALHYAHDYYLAEDRGMPSGLDFPGGHAPDYGDFLYFACVIGTSGQTADVSFTSRAMRRIGTVHCVLAFVFNTTILALTINIASGLLMPV